MALIKCQECGKEISDTSKRCIHCGAKIKKEKNEEVKKNKKKIKLSVLYCIKVPRNTFIHKITFAFRAFPRLRVYHGPRLWRPFSHKQVLFFAPMGDVLHLCW